MNVELSECLKNAFSYESREGHGADGLSTKFVGTVKSGNRMYDLYKDTNGNYWYIVRIIKENGTMSEYEAIFGHPEREMRRRKKK